MSDEQIDEFHQVSVNVFPSLLVYLVPNAVMSWEIMDAGQITY